MQKREYLHSQKKENLNGKINKTELSKAIKGKTKINEELLRMSKIMNT